MGCPSPPDSAAFWLATLLCGGGPRAARVSSAWCSSLSTARQVEQAQEEEAAGHS